MAGLGYVSLNTFKNSEFIGISTDESICGMLFDYGSNNTVFDDYATIKHYFSNSQIQVINNMEEAEEMGLTDNNFMNGIPYYHLELFFRYVEKDTPLYLMFSDCTNGFEILEEFQRQVNGRMFQIGVWTEKKLWRLKDYETIEFTSLVTDLQDVAEIIGGKIGIATETSTPVSIILCANTAFLDNSEVEYGEVDYRKLPNGTLMNCPNISVILGQDGSDKIHNMQLRNREYAPVGLLGIAMGCLCLAPVEESIGYVEKHNINWDDDITYPELGFGIVSDTLVDNDYGNIFEISETRKNLISIAGYILPVTYPAKEGEVFFSNDQTLSNGDYKTISANRTMNKCRRVVRNVMMPYVNGNIYLDPQNGNITANDATILINSITSALDKELINKNGQMQISDRFVTIDTDQNVLAKDKLEISYSVVPTSVSSTIEVNESYEV